MELDLLLEPDFCECCFCCATCCVELFISSLATTTGKWILLLAKLSGVALDVMVVLNLIANVFPIAEIDQYEVLGHIVLIILIFWERGIMFLILFKKMLCCKLCKGAEQAKETQSSRCSIYIHKAYLKYATLKASEYETNKRNESDGNDEIDGSKIKNGLIVLYYGSLFSTTDYLGSIWKSDDRKYKRFACLYGVSLFFVTYLTFGVIFIWASTTIGFKFSFTSFTCIYDEEREQPLLTSSVFLAQGFGIFQHWMNLAHYIKVKSDDLNRRKYNYTNEEHDHEEKIPAGTYTPNSVELAVNVQTNDDQQPKTPPSNSTQSNPDDNSIQQRVHQLVEFDAERWEVEKKRNCCCFMFGCICPKCCDYCCWKSCSCCRFGVCLKCCLSSCGIYMSTVIIGWTIMFIIACSL